jgi:hypothetical protein
LTSLFGPANIPCHGLGFLLNTGSTIATTLYDSTHIYRVNTPIVNTTEFNPSIFRTCALFTHRHIPGYAMLPLETMTSWGDVRAVLIAALAVSRSRAQFVPQSWPRRLSSRRLKLASMGAVSEQNRTVYDETWVPYACMQRKPFRTGGSCPICHSETPIT